jgi:Tfp pilus assembly protein PilF
MTEQASVFVKLSTGHDTRRLRSTIRVRAGLASLNVSGVDHCEPPFFCLTGRRPAINALSMDDERLKLRAIALWQQGYQAHLEGDLGRAVELYTRSIAASATAEAYTFRGWAYSRMGRIDEAVAECHKAIEVDPNFGNPYNDIGAYLMAKGELDHSVGWFEKAKDALRYEPRHFPFMNLGRVYAAKGMVLRAIEEFEGALRIEPDEPFCLKALAELHGMLN